MVSHSQGRSKFRFGEIFSNGVVMLVEFLKKTRTVENFKRSEGRDNGEFLKKTEDPIFSISFIFKDSMTTQRRGQS